jgi:eukaryotic-like serine/threonine-protein kinase
MLKTYQRFRISLAVLNMSVSNQLDLGETVDLPQSSAASGLAPQPPASELRRPKKSDERPAAVLVEGSGAGLSDQTYSLLRNRLRYTSLLLSAGLFAFFVVRLLFINQLGTQFHSIILCLHGLVTLLTAFIGWRLCRNCSYVTSHSRITELVIFGSVGVFFSMVSYAVLVDGAKHGQVAATAPMWMTLIFTYALFIPNTWQRAAVVIGTMTATPILLLLIVKLTADGPDVLIIDPSYLRQGILENVMVLLLSAAISIWGVHMVNSLRREAFEAKQLGQYQLRRRLGAGGMGEVYLAEHLMLKRRCAIKVIRPDRAGDAATLARFEREVRATAQLTHWNSVEIFDYGRAADGTFYYVMEYLPGMNLEEIVRMHGPLPQDRIVHLLTQACDALREAHEQGLIHRDIKPANIFAAHRGGLYDVVKLLDFGLAKPMNLPDDPQITQMGMISGTPHFMAPEQTLGEPPDERSDIYSLGVVAWFLATGRLLFEESNPLKVIMAHAHQVAPRPSEFNRDLSPAFDAVILKCLEKRPELRPQSVAELRKLLRSVPPSAGWSDEQAAQWWTCHGCPHKKKLDDAVQAGQFA